MKKSRRRFLRAVAAGGAALVVAPAVDLARAATTARKRVVKRPAAPAATPAVSSPLAGEIAKQKASLEQTLKVVRDVPLENGADLAFVFRPMRPEGGR